jgi:hypothetical protein
MRFLKGWDLHIYGCEDNQEFLERNISNFFHHKVSSPYFNHFQYNMMFTDAEFWKKYLDYERVIIFQHDSMILRDGIDEFMSWNYVGAPWKFQHQGGNGGLSLRNPKEMYDVCKRVKWMAYSGNEDVYFSNNSKGVAPREVCSKFSCETIFQLGTFGYHAIDQWLTKEQLTLIKNQYVPIQTRI